MTDTPKSAFGATDPNHGIVPSEPPAPAPADEEKKDESE